MGTNDGKPCIQILFNLCTVITCQIDLLGKDPSLPWQTHVQCVLMLSDHARRLFTVASLNVQLSYIKRAVLVYCDRLRESELGLH